MRIPSLQVPFVGFQSTRAEREFRWREFYRTFHIGAAQGFESMVFFQALGASDGSRKFSVIAIEGDAVGVF